MTKTGSGMGIGTIKFKGGTMFIEGDNGAGTWPVAGKALPKGLDMHNREAWDKFVAETNGKRAQYTIQDGACVQYHLC